MVCALQLQRVVRAKIDPSLAKYIILDLIAECLVVGAHRDWCNDANEEKSKV